MGLDLEYNAGQTPLDEDEKESLLIPTISTRNELDEFEQQNIEQAILWTLKRSVKPGVILSGEFIRSLHKRMFGNVWAWAGQFRKTNKNLGVDKWQIPTELHNLIEDTRYWIKNKTYPPDEIAIRFKHRIVSIHCFPNGNGRHSRLMADIIIQKVFKMPVFSWGAGTAGANHNNIREEYLAAIKKADAGNIEPLTLFARS
jgi:Fic-DOC domain mobile mystery protein B